jgi:hypothetical protein
VILSAVGHKILAKNVLNEFAKTSLKVKAYVYFEWFD